MAGCVAEVPLLPMPFLLVGVYGVGSVRREQSSKSRPVAGGEWLVISGTVASGLCLVRQTWDHSGER